MQIRTILLAASATRHELFVTTNSACKREDCVALARLPGRPPARAPAPEKIPARDRTILRLKAKERSNRWIAGRLGLSETAIRKALRRLGWNPSSEPSPLPLPFELQAG